MGRTTSSAQDEIDKEQQYVDRVYVRLGGMVERAAAVGQEGRQRGLLDYTGEIKEDDYRSLFERDVLVDHAVRRLAVLDAQREGLVFGRLDQLEGVVRYVGRIGVRDEEQEPLVLDWRAPAASVFYQATPVRPQGVIRRRVLRCLGQRVTGVEDDLLDPDNAPEDLVVLGDGALMAALTAARGQQMRDIVATIQQEQDLIIRAPSSGATLIGGGPGTGKTVVALHRAAYLLYTERRRISGGGVLVVGPSSVFMSYIERVLPSLGEHEATLRSLGELVDGIAATRRDSSAAAAVKGSLRMRRVLGRAVRDGAPGTPQEFRIYAGGLIRRLNVRDLDRVRNDVLRRGAQRNRGRAEATRTLLAALWSQGPSGRSRSEFDDEVENSAAFGAFLDAWWPMLAPSVVFGWLADPDRLARYAKGALSPAEVSTLLASWDGAKEPSVEDVPLLDEIDSLLGEVPRTGPEREPWDDFGDVPELVSAFERQVRPEHSVRNDGYAHVLVDEAQDLSPMQWRMVGRRGRHGSWTIVGDPAQSSWPDAPEATSALDAALGRRERRQFTLHTNYRNSAEIFAVAGRVIRQEFPSLELPNAVRATGLAPTHVVAGESELSSSVRAAVDSLLGEVAGTVGVIVATHRVEPVADWLEGVDPDRVSIVTALASKGLEYDGVVVVEPAEIVAESTTGIRTLYVVLTRATQRLITVGAEGAWSGLPASPP